MNSLRVRITAISIAAILATLAAFIGVSFFTVGQESNRAAEEKMHLLSENAQQSLDAYLDSIEQSVETTSRIATDSLDSITLIEYGVRTPADQRTAEQTAQLDAYLSQYCDKLLETFSSVANQTNGIITYYYCINPEVSVTEHGFFYSKVGKAGFEAQEPLDARELDPNDLEHTTWYYTPIKRGNPSWVGPYKAHFLNELETASYLTPIYKAGVLIGVLGMDIPFETLTSRVDSIQVYETGFACLFDGDGNLLYHPEFAAGSNSEKALDALGSVIKLDGDGNVPVPYSVDGDNWQYSYSTLSDGTKLVVTAPLSEINASWWTLTSSILLIAALILAVFIPFILMRMRALVGPLQKLTDAALKISSGDYDVELDYVNDDEVGLLTNAFRQMRDRQWQHISDLNSRVCVDALTGVKNKNAFDITAGGLNDAIRQGVEGTMPEFALIMFDCNRLKEINDEFGHGCGDTYLQAASSLICRVFAHSPVYRIGGDEFVVLLQQQDYENREELLLEFDRLNEDINASTSEPWKHVDIAKGMSMFHPDEDPNVEAVLHRADTRMYENKRKGR